MSGTPFVGREDRHFIRDLGASQLLVSDRRCLMHAPLDTGTRSPAGAVSLGVLVALFDVGASDPAMIASRPDWTATQDLTMHGGVPLAEGPIVVDSRLVRVGKKTVVVASDVYDGHGCDDLEELRSLIDDGPALASAGSGLITFARLPGSAAPGMDDYDPAGWVGQIRGRIATAPPAGSVYERLGHTVVDGRTGHLVLERTPYLTNSIGTIVGGAQAVLIESAAEAMRPGLVATDMQIHFLSQLKVGPARTRGAVVRDARDHAVVRVDVLDAGNDDQLLAVATATLLAR